MMDHTYDIFESIDLVDAAAWEQVRTASGAGVFMDRRFLAAVESGMAESCKFRYVVLYDAAGAPVCSACLSTTTLALADVADPRSAATLRRIPSFLSPLTTLRILIGGLPFSAGQANVIFRPGCDLSQVLTLLDRIARQLGREDGASLVVFKEFDQPAADRMELMTSLGYTRFSTPQMHTLMRRFRDLDDYCASLRSRYRRQIVNSRKRLQQNGVSVDFVEDPSEILGMLRPDVHQLYLNVVSRAEMKLETLTEEVFRELVRRLGPQVAVAALRREGEVIGIAWLLEADDSVDILFAGFRDDLETELDLYFNVAYAALDLALQRDAPMIRVGQTCPFFKTRLGCEAENRFAFAKGVRPFMAWCFRNLLVRLIPEPEPVPSLRVFREEGRDTDTVAES